MPYKDPDQARQWRRDNQHKRNTQARKDYERERKNRKRVESYMLLPEPERTQKLSANARRRAYQMRWTQEKKRNSRLP